MLKKAAVARVATLSAASCAACGHGAAVKHQTSTYTCCRASNIMGPWHPGQTLTIHWIVKPGRLSDKPKATKLTLKASLTGPYESVAGLKSATRSGPAARGR